MERRERKYLRDSSNPGRIKLLIKNRIISTIRCHPEGRSFPPRDVVLGGNRIIPLERFWEMKNLARKRGARINFEGELWVRRRLPIYRGRFEQQITRGGGRRTR